MDDFRTLEAWVKSRALACDVYRETQSFPRIEMFGLVSQMRRAAVSVISNFAEAHGRASNKERMHFLHISRGSLLELEAQTLIATDLGYLTCESSDALVSKIAEAARLVSGLIRHYKRKEEQSKPN